MRRAAKIDLAQPEVVRAFHDGGATVQSLASIGAGVPDLLVGYRGIDFLVETKTEEYAKDHPETLKRQRMWAKFWGGRPVVRACNRREALEILAAIANPVKP